MTNTFGFMESSSSASSSFGFIPTTNDSRVSLVWSENEIYDLKKIVTGLKAEISELNVQLNALSNINGSLAIENERLKNELRRKSH
jgi:predicted RNase H-like nuclease (RuvC/YqgF family)